MRRKSIFIFIALVLLILAILTLTYPMWLNVGTFQRKLNAEYVPTAHYLMAHPLLTPEYVAAVAPAVGSIVKAGQEICVTLLPGALSNSGDPNGEIMENIASNVRISINMQLIPSDATRVQMRDILHRLPNGQFSGQVQVCFNADLHSGSHIFQIEMRNSRLGVFGFGELFSYTWAHKVEA